MLFKRKDGGNWYYKFTVKGQTVYRSTRTKNKNQAEEIATKAKAQAYDTLVFGKKKAYLWQDAVIRWINEKEKKSINSDKYIFKWLRPYLDDIYVHQIDTDLIETIIAEKQKTVGNSRVNRTMALIRSVLIKALTKWKWQFDMPTIRFFKENNIRDRVLTSKEEKDLLTLLPYHTAAMARFSLATGLRESNVTGLKWDKINLKKRTLWVKANQAKGEKIIHIPLNDEAMQIILDQKGKHSTNVFTFRNMPIKKAGSSAWYSALARAGIVGFTWHGLRHTWASRHAERGTPLIVLQELGGWSSLRMVLRYSHLSSNKLHSYAANIENYDDALLA